MAKGVLGAVMTAVHAREEILATAASSTAPPLRLVLIHGFGGQLDVWDDVVADLREHVASTSRAATLLRLDMPGCGSSRTPGASNPES